MRRFSLAAFALVAACGGANPAGAPVGPRAHKLQAPLALDATAPGAVYLTLFAAHVQPNWAQFLEDCRLRLPPTHPLNDAKLVAVADLAISRTGAVTLGAVGTSGNADFDQAVADVMGDVHSVEPPPTDLLGDDDRLHLAWTFARDGRQAGAAAARMLPLRQDVVAVTTRLLDHGELTRAAERVALDKEAGSDRAARLVAIAALREALAGSVDVRMVAIDAVARAHATALIEPTRALLRTSLDSNLQLAVTRTLAALEDRAAVEPIAAMLEADILVNDARALADTRALVQLGAAARAQEIIRTQLTKQAVPSPDAVSIPLHAHSLAPSPSLDAAFTKWFAKGDARLRAAVCAGQPIEASVPMEQLIARGLRDADASVRASCADAAGRQLYRRDAVQKPLDKQLGKQLEAQLRDLVHDRDRLVRIRAYGSLAIALTPFARNHTDYKGHRPDEQDVFVQAATDSDPEIRAAAMNRYPPNTLRALIDDPDPVVRAAAFTAWARSASFEPEDESARTELAARLADDSAANVRLAAIPEITNNTILSKLAAGDTNDVASAALIHLAELRGRASSTSDLMLALAKAPPASADRVRIALAWLLAP